MGGPTRYDAPLARPVAQLEDPLAQCLGAVVQLRGAGNENPWQRWQVGRWLEGDHLVVPPLVHQLRLQPQVPLEGVERAEPAGVHDAATCWFAASCQASRSGSTTSRHSTTTAASLDTFAATSRSSSQV